MQDWRSAKIERLAVHRSVNYEQTYHIALFIAFSCFQALDLTNNKTLVDNIGVGTTGAPGAGAPLDFLVEIYLC